MCSVYETERRGRAFVYVAKLSVLVEYSVAENALDTYFAFECASVKFYVWAMESRDVNLKWRRQ